MKKIWALKYAGHILVFAATLAYFFSTKDMPLLATLGFESANLFVAIFAPILFLLAAIQPKKRGSNDFRSMILPAQSFLLAHIAFLTLLLAYNGLFLTSCSKGAGLIPFLVVLIPPLVLNVTIGTIIACLVNRLWLKLLLSIGLYTLYFTVIACCWWSDPTFRILTHGSLLMSSDLLQGGLLSPPIFAFRMATLLFSSALIVFGLRFLSTSRNLMFNIEMQRPAKSAIIIALLFCGGLLLSSASKNAMGKNSSDLRRDYSLQVEQDSIIVRADPLKTSMDEANAILAEALYFKSQINKQLGPLKNEPLTIWLHHDRAQKFLYTGAKNVHFALPRHRQIHISSSTTPHAVLGHELAHIFVGEYSSTILALPGEWLVIPNMALTEGLAMVLSRELNVSYGLSMMQKAQALYHADIKVDVRKLFTINPKTFAMSQPRSSYIYSGAFIEFFLDSIEPKSRAEKLHQLIKHGQFKKLFDDPKDYRDLIANFNNYLAGDLPPYATLWAKKNFTSHSILGSDCKENYQPQKEAFTIATLNQDQEQVASAIAALPAGEIFKLILPAIKSELAQEHYALALAMIKDVEHLVKEQSEAALQDLSLQKFNALFHLNNFNQARDVLLSLSPQNFSPSQKRLLLVLESFLHAHMLAGTDTSPYKSAISLLFSSSKNNLSRMSDFSYQRGKSGPARSTDLKKANLLVSYIDARFKMNEKKYEEALFEILDLLNNKEQLPPLILLESHFMLARTHMELGHNKVAQAAFTYLLSLQLSLAQQIEAKSMLQRLNYKLNQPQ